MLFVTLYLIFFSFSFVFACLNEAGTVSLLQFYNFTYVDCSNKRFFAIHATEIQW